MGSVFTRLAIQARHNAGLTQEAAAERIGVALRTIAHYEAGRIPADDIVARMMQVYRAPYLGYAYLSQESEVGRALLPQITNVSGIASGAMQIRVAIKKAVKMYDRLEEICCDDVVSRDEQRDYERCWSELDNLMASVTAMKFSPRKGKSPAGATAGLSERINF